MAIDSRGVPLTGADAFALARYETALEQFQSYVGDPILTIDEALQAAPSFIAGHLLKALALYTLAERKFVPTARQALAAARQHDEHANDRERGLIRAGELLVEGSWDEACQVIDRVLVDHPRDALALQVGHVMDFYRGDALNLRTRVSRVLPYWDAAVPGYSYVLGMHAFGLEEMNQYIEAETAAMRALCLQPKDGWAVHAAVHVMEMQGRIDEGIAFLASREQDWAPGNSFAFHNFWHLALFFLDGEHYDRAIALFDRHIHPEPAAMTRDVGLPLANGIVAFARGRYADSIAAIETVRDFAHRFGGSHAQRDLFTLTLIEAAIRSEDGRRARHYICERLVHKPASKWGGRLWSRADARNFAAAS